MDKSTGSPSLEHMAILYGPRTEQALDAALGPFCKLRDEYRRRFKEDGIALTQDKAFKAYRLVAPLYAPDMTPDEAAREAAMNAICFPCFKTGGYGFREPAVKASLEGFERMIAEGSQTLHVRHIGEAQAREVDPWTRFVLYIAVDLFVLVVGSNGTPPPGEVRQDFERAQAILGAVSVPRPRGRSDPRRTVRRNTYIVTMLVELEACGLPVTSSGGDSLAGTLAEALGERERTIRDVWNECPLRESRLNDALPAELRLPESVIRHRRNADPEKPRIAPDVRCANANCGKTGKVPVYRTREGGTGLCTDCLPW